MSERNEATLSLSWRECLGILLSIVLIAGVASIHLL